MCVRASHLQGNQPGERRLRQVGAVLSQHRPAVVLAAAEPPQEHRRHPCPRARAYSLLSPRSIGRSARPRRAYSLLSPRSIGRSAPRPRPPVSVAPLGRRRPLRHGVGSASASVTFGHNPQARAAVTFGRPASPRHHPRQSGGPFALHHRALTRRGAD
eukprot:8129406-Pyramimonas_sp.AAC.1